MRQIKFRAWDTIKKEWVTERITVGMKNEKSCPELEKDQKAILCVFAGMNQCVLMQFTGLLDKNGKEIYEGDVVKIHNLKETWKREESDYDWRVFQIIWNRYLWSLNNENLSKPLADYDTRTLEPWDIEVLGNIYENPELLTRETPKIRNDF